MLVVVIHNVFINENLKLVFEHLSEFYLNLSPEKDHLSKGFGVLCGI